MNIHLRKFSSLYMIYKKNTRITCNVDNIVIRLTEHDGRKLSVAAYYGNTEVASIVSVIHNLGIPLVSIKFR